MSNERILFVDDEPAVLEAYRRMLHREFPLDTAVGGKMGLASIKDNGPYAVVVSDMRMPEMDGVQFLANVHRTTPDTVRLALTGYADVDTAARAVNEGSIFKFLTKPCDKQTLVSALSAAMIQHKLIVAEKQLLENTLLGCVKVMSEILSYANPAAFGRAMRLNRYVQHVVSRLGMVPDWRYEAAAMLSQLGCVTLHPDVVEAVYAGGNLSAEELKKYEAHPIVSWDLLSRIPRMEQVAWMIVQQHESISGSDPLGTSSDVRVRFGGSLLRVLLAYDRLITRGVDHQDAIVKLRSNIKETDLNIVDALQDIEHVSAGQRLRCCTVADLAVGMVLHQDIRTKENVLIVSKGQEITYTLLARLRAFSQRKAIPERIYVEIPALN